MHKFLPSRSGRCYYCNSCKNARHNPSIQTHAPDTSYIPDTLPLYPRMFACDVYTLAPGPALVLVLSPASLGCIPLLELSSSSCELDYTRVLSGSVYGWC